MNYGWLSHSLGDHDGSAREVDLKELKTRIDLFKGPKGGVKDLRGDPLGTARKYLPKNDAIHGGGGGKGRCAKKFH